MKILMHITVFLVLLTAMQISAKPGARFEAKEITQEVLVLYEDLPLPVQKVLKQDPYKHWKFKEAFRVQYEKMIYKITLVRGTKTKTLLLDENGSHTG
ncbi:MAG TPA: hypothetical protein VK177_18320 [Flavobacteriales bacterium]|nr:hypothetical protein [Flavobacteriales bacterium]